MGSFGGLGGRYPFVLVRFRRSFILSSATMRRKVQTKQGNKPSIVS